MKKKGGMRNGCYHHFFQTTREKERSGRSPFILLWFWWCCLPSSSLCMWLEKGDSLSLPLSLPPSLSSSLPLPLPRLPTPVMFSFRVNVNVNDGADDLGWNSWGFVFFCSLSCLSHVLQSLMPVPTVFVDLCSDECTVINTLYSRRFHIFFSTEYYTTLHWI